MVAVIRQLLRSKESFPVTRTYFNYFKEGYREALIMSWIYSIIGEILFVDLLFVQNWYLRICTICHCIFLLAFGNLHLSNHGSL